MKKTVKLWAIDPRSPEGPGLLGQFGWSWRPSNPIPDMPMLWRTRREAEAARREQFPPGCWTCDPSRLNAWRPKVARVEVTVVVVR